MAIVRFKNHKDFLNYFLGWNSELDGFIFRGHSQAKYKLIPTVFRCSYSEKMDCYTRLKGGELYYEDKILSQIHYEYLLLRQFYQLADSHGLRVPNSELLRKTLPSRNDMSWLDLMSSKDGWLPAHLEEVAALAQHYGIHTRLLDWTYDPFIALYFALKDWDKSTGPLAIWCLNKDRYIDLKRNHENLSMRFVTPPCFDNPNLNAQKGIFTYSPTGYDNQHRISIDPRPLQQIIKSELPDGANLDYLLKVVILPRKLARKAYIEIINHGYGAAKIFPGYKGVSEQILESLKLSDRNITN
ncbi:FRG domain-containing protein [Rouxiella badensis]|uniref:FRG domain-containing protein n=1 Tax=Rouxiella badensis TaxID=1646377 RepID=UPI001D158409|nr:FRG domain-containing protein [Rouxiella badensis]MCC3704165.1 FRG domain-containing protein [Rouxiella badensis]